MRRVMILGNSPDACARVSAYTSNAEIWSTKGIHAKCQHPEPKRIFEIHPLDWKGQESELMSVARGKAETGQLPLCIMREHIDAIPTSIAYPMEDVQRVVRQKYFTCTVSYMLALALLEHTLYVADPIKELIMVGTFADPHTEYWRNDGSYWQQRASCEYLLGLLEGRGVEVTIDPESWLFRGRNYADLAKDGVQYVGFETDLLDEWTNWGNSTK